MLGVRACSVNHRPSRRGKCCRPGCHRIADRRKLCPPHYDRAYPLQGYVDPSKAREHVRQLRQRGFTLNMLEAHGVTRSVVARIDRGRQKIHRMTERNILSVPVPALVLASAADVPAIGVRRRLQALAAIGWTQKALAEKLGWTQASLANHVARDYVSGRTARQVDELFRELQLTPGPSQLSRTRAQRKGWAAPLEWEEDDIDNPSAQPNIGYQVHVTAIERVNELRELGVRDIHQIAQRLGTKPKSVERLLARHQKEAAA